MQRLVANLFDKDPIIKHPEHNVQRARAQFRLVDEIGKNEEMMKEIVAGLV